MEMHRTVSSFYLLIRSVLQPREDRHGVVVIIAHRERDGTLTRQLSTDQPLPLQRGVAEDRAQCRYRLVIRSGESSDGAQRGVGAMNDFRRAEQLRRSFAAVAALG